MFVCQPSTSCHKLYEDLTKVYVLNIMHYIREVYSLLTFGVLISPVYEVHVYSGYIVFAFSVNMFVCVYVCV